MYNYLLLLAGIFLPFLGLAVIFGSFRRTTPLAVATHSTLYCHPFLFSEQAGTFPAAVIPLFFVIGYVSWEQWRAASKWWQKNDGLWRGHLVFVHALNFILLAVLCVTYSKRSRVEALYSLRDHRPLRGIIIEDTYGQEAPMPPLFYLGQWDLHVLPWTDPSADLSAALSDYPFDERPEIILFFGTEDLNERIARATEAMGPLHEIGRSEPGLVDRVVHWLNPVNRNETIVNMATRSK
ncbi:MAG: hypothetical protein IPI00_19215 [Flavobacteriales bacterium]|nr:hypothetical protein [Flavobacteriales bacterium]